FFLDYAAAKVRKKLYVTSLLPAFLPYVCSSDFHVAFSQFRSGCNRWLTDCKAKLVECNALKVHHGGYHEFPTEEGGDNDPCR
ncbi:MAG: hypothetical protein ACI4B9_03535, partial [Eggerthellaceae bacterium]